MLSINFENDKFIPTPLPEICAPRQNLLKQLNRSAKNRVTAICAPAGYGKTVSALLWVRASHRNCVWIGLDKYDNAPFVFFKMFCTVILSIQPDNLNMAKILTSPTFHSSPLEQTIDLLKEFVPDERSYVLVLDDLHTISNKLILKSLSIILKQMPHTIHILLVSRCNLPEELVELVADGDIVSAKELAFSAQEIWYYYCALGRSITKSQAKTVFEATGGWAIGIHVLSQSEEFDRIQADGPLLDDYMNRNIWEKWDQQFREFMLITSIVDEFDEELCQILTGKKDVKNMMGKLLAHNLFIVKTSETSYRYQPLFLEFLRGRLKEYPIIDVQNLCLKVADFYFEEQSFFKALSYYTNAENDDGIDRCFFQLNSGILDFNTEERLYHFSALILDKLPEKLIRNNISLIIESMWTNYQKGNTEVTLEYIDMIYDHISSGQNLKRLKEMDFLGFICTTRFLDFRKSICDFAEEFQEWLKVLPIVDLNDIHIHTATLTENFPLLHRSVRDYLELTLMGDSQLQIMNVIFNTFFPKEANVLSYCIKAGLSYEQNKLEQAYDAINLAQCELKKDLRFELSFCVFILLSHILNAMNKTKESENAMTHFYKRIKEVHALSLTSNFLSVDTKFKLWNANQTSAKVWLEQPFVTNDNPLQFYKINQYFTTVRAYIVLSEHTKAAEYLVKLKKLSTAYRRPLDFAEAEVLLAVLQWVTGSKQEAVRSLEEVLISLQPYHAVRIIAEEGSAVLPILKSIADRVEKVDYQGPLESSYLSQVLLCAGEVSKIRKGITALSNQKPVKLSKQQKYVLLLLAQGYKNAQIVDITGLTLNTIRAHTKILYQKLGVNKAADAVIEAKRLGILEF
jgi:ATP-dependent transcriptional regulator